jgi:hypothetical protein
MRRSALASFFQRVIVASLPLGAGACHDRAAELPDAGGAAADLAVVVPSDLALATPDLYDICDVTYPVTRVNNDPSRFPDGGFGQECVVGNICVALCPAGYMQCCAPMASDGGAVIVDCSRPCLGGGRRPEGLAVTRNAGANVGDYFAAMAHLEAASVTSFRRLGRALAGHGAPARLVAATRRAAADEIRHARTLRAFAARHDAVPAAVRVAPWKPRPLAAVARENAAEGCVRETFGALVASWQARRAEDRSFAAAMSTIAADETRHAELSWTIARFCRAKLSPAENRRVRRARRAAVDALAHELDHAWPDDVAARAGLPDRARARRFFDETRRSLWR